jgi:hypothetical protein
VELESLQTAIFKYGRIAETVFMQFLLLALLLAMYQLSTQVNKEHHERIN